MKWHNTPTLWASIRQAQRRELMRSRSIRLLQTQHVNQGDLAGKIIFGTMRAERVAGHPQSLVWLIGKHQAWQARQGHERIVELRHLERLFLTTFLCRPLQIRQAMRSPLCAVYRATVQAAKAPVDVPHLSLLQAGR